MNKTLFLLFLIYGNSCLSQTSVEQYVSMHSSEEIVKNFLSTYDVVIEDKRSFVNNKIDYQQLETYINGFMEVLIPYSSSEMSIDNKLRPKKIVINLEFFNLTEGSSSEGIIKAIAFVQIDGGGYSKLRSDFNLSAEEFTSIKLKNIQKQKNLSELEVLLNNFSKKFARKIVDRILEEIKYEDHLVYEVISIGTAIGLEDIDKTKENASLFALVRASELAFGMKVTNTSEILDFGDVTDLVLSETGGTVLHHQILEGSFKLLEDGHCGLLVKSLIMKK